MPLRPDAARQIAGLLQPAGPVHPWTGDRFSSAWSSRVPLDVTLVTLDLVSEVDVSDPGRSEEGGVRLRPNEGQGGEVFDLAKVEFGLEREVVLVERLVVRQFREPQPLAEALVAGDGQFLGQHQVEEVEIARLGLVGLAGVLVNGLREVGRPSLPAVVRTWLPVSSLKRIPLSWGEW